MAFHEIGRGRKVIVKFRTIMNVSLPVNKDSFDVTSDNKLFDAYMSRATESMKRAAFEVRKITNRSCKNDDLIDCGISINESWQSKSFAWIYLK